jgi:hypothetical protein
LRRVWVLENGASHIVVAVLLERTPTDRGEEGEES